MVKKIPKPKEPHVLETFTGFCPHLKNRYDLTLYDNKTVKIIRQPSVGLFGEVTHYAEITEETKNHLWLIDKIRQNPNPIVITPPVTPSCNPVTEDANDLIATTVSPFNSICRNPLA